MARRHLSASCKMGSFASRGKKINSPWGNMLISSYGHSDPFSTLQCSAPYPEGWKDCLNESELGPGFQLLSDKGLSKRRSREGERIMRLGLAIAFNPRSLLLAR